MAAIDYPRELTPAFWNPHKAVLAKIKNCPPQQMSEGLTELAKRHNAMEWGTYETGKLTTLAQVEQGLKDIDEQHKNFLRVTAEADSTADSGDYFAKEGKKYKEVPKEPIAAAAAISKAAKAYLDGIKDLESKARDDLTAKLGKLKAGEKKAGAPGAVALSPKAIADGKALAALLKKSVATLRSPKGSPVPVRFLMFQEEKKLRVFLGPKPDSWVAKLKAQFGPKAKLKRIRDPKGEVKWEKASLTFISDILKSGLAKQIQIALREQTKLSVKVRIKKSDGSVDEAESVPDLTDDQLKADPEEEKALQEAGKNFAKELAELQPKITEALKSGKPETVKRLKELVASVQSHGKAQQFTEALDDLGEIETLLEGGDESEGDEAEAEGDAKGTPAGVPPAKAFSAKLTALMPKIRAAIAAGGDAAKQIKDMTEQAGKLVQSQVQADVDKANALLSKVEDLLGAAGGGAFSVQKLATARLEWIATRDKAITEITRLSRAIVDAYRGETDQQAQVKAAITKLAGLATRLKSGLDNELDAALTAKDAASREQLANKAKNSLKSIKKLMDEDELMQSLDGNEILGDMHVVAPMKERLSAIEAALG